MTAAPQDTPGGNLPAARRRLEYAISALCEPKPVTVHRDDGSTHITWLDSAYSQLLDAVSGQTGERSGGAASAPLWPDMLDIRKKIDKQVAKWNPEYPLPDVADDEPTPTTVARLWAINARKWRVEDVDLVESRTAIIDGWVKEIAEKLNPEPVIFLMAPSPAKGAASCTACGTDYVWRKDPSDNNKPKRQPALRVTKDGCRCQACHANWAPGSLRLLAAALGYPLPAGCLE